MDLNKYTYIHTIYVTICTIGNYISSYYVQRPLTATKLVTLLDVNSFRTKVFVHERGFPSGLFFLQLLLFLAQMLSWTDNNNK